MSEIFNIENKIFTAVGDDPVKTKPFVPVPIPHDAVANGRIFPGRVIAGYNLPASSGLAFGAYMISQYEATPEAAGVYWCMALNSGSTGGRYWFGYLFRGQIASIDFDEAPKEFKVTNAQAYTMGN